MVKNQKKSERTVTSKIISIMLVLLIVVFALIMCLFAGKICEIQKELTSLETQVSSIEVNNNDNQSSDYINEYIEITNKADAEMDRLVSVVGILATAYTIFGALIVFRAPHEIDKRITSLNQCLEAANNAAEDAQYQSKLTEAALNRYNGEQTNYERIKSITEIIEQYPQKIDAYLVRGFIYDDNGQYDLAIKDYAIVLNLDKNNAYALNDMAIAYSKKGNHKKAIKLYTKSLSLKEDPEVFANRGSSYDDNGEIELAEKDYQKAIDIDESCKSAYINRAALYQRMMESESDIEQKEKYRQLVINDLRQSLDIDPDDKIARRKLQYIIKPNEEMMIAKNDERIGDLLLRNNNLLNAWRQYANATILYCSKIFIREADYSDDVVRILNKMFSINSSSIFDIINSSPDKLYETFCGAIGRFSTQKYIQGDVVLAEKCFLYLRNFININSAPSLNLAYIKRRGEATITSLTVRELLREYDKKTDSIWCANTALCYVDGTEDYGQSWDNAIDVINRAGEIDAAVDWWSNVDVVGARESNIVLLLLHLAEDFWFEDFECIENRIRYATDDGYQIPQSVLDRLLSSKSEDTVTT